MVVRWPGHIRPGTAKNQLFAALDWLPTLVDIGGGAKGDALKNRIEAGQYPGIVKTTLDGFDQRDYLEGTSEKSARDNDACRRPCGSYSVNRRPRRPTSSPASRFRPPASPR
jgi:arylsulfatase A-like enzyme